MFKVLIPSLLFAAMANAQNPAPLSNTYMGGESRARGQCFLQVLTQSPLLVEVLFSVLSAKHEMIHFEVITLEARPFSSVFNPDFDRRREVGKTSLLNETVYLFDYASLKIAPPLGEAYAPVSFLRSQIAIRKTKSGEWFEARPIFDCPLMLPSAAKRPTI